MENITLQAIYRDEVIFESKGKWLFPIFDLENFLLSNHFELADIKVQDKVVGKAAALLFIHLGIGYVQGEIMSELAKEALGDAGIPYSYNVLVKQINCKTEKLLFDINDANIAYTMLGKLAGRF